MLDIFPYIYQTLQPLLQNLKLIQQRLDSYVSFKTSAKLKAMNHREEAFRLWRQLQY